MAAAIGGISNAVLGAFAMPDTFNFTHDGWVHLGKLAFIGALIPVATYLKQSPLPPIEMQKSVVPLCILVALLGLVGCSPANQQQAARAADNASIIVKSFQAGEIQAYQSHLVSPSDHQFIQQSLSSVAEIGLVADSCIKTATTKQATLQCVDTAADGVQKIYDAGGTYIKADKSRNDFQIAMLGVKTTLQTIGVMLGGTQ